MIVLLVIGIIILIIGVYVWQSNKGSQGDPKDRLGGSIASIIGVVLIVASLIFGSFTTIPAGHRGVVIRFGAITGSILDEGLRTKLPFLDSVVKMSVQTQKYEADAASASRDLQDVSTTIALNWHLDPGTADEVYRTLGLEFIDRIAAPAIQETVKQVTARYNAEDLILKREEVKAAITENLSTRLMERGIITETVSITEFQFSATFIAAIEAKVAAEQAVFEARNKLELGYRDCLCDDTTLRKRLDWEEQAGLALDTERSRRVHRQRATTGSACSMCGQYCAMELVAKYLGVKATKC